MLRLLLASCLLAAPVAAASTSAAVPNEWGIARAPGSCMLHATSAGGTLLSIWSFSGQEKIGVLLQNRQWDTLREGQNVQLEVGFGGGRAWPVEATARREIDSDGPGLLFTIRPSEIRDGTGFLDALVDSKGMEISRDGAATDSLKLAGSREAIAALARCTAELWAEPAEAELDKEDSPPEISPTT